MPRKKRTRSHVIADLGINYFERRVLECGYVVERVEFDYGIDLIMWTFNSEGETENGPVFVQVKSTERPRLLADGATIRLDIERRDLETWLREPMPVILVLYDASDDAAYWSYVQQYFESPEGFSLDKVRGTTTLLLDKANVVSQEAVRTFARFRDRVMAQSEGMIRHLG